ncbi:MAG: hypothetical protein ACTS6P_00370 [Candidatus Hodgkinia cicadicola]
MLNYFPSVAIILRGCCLSDLFAKLFCLLINVKRRLADLIRSFYIQSMGC